MERKLGFIFDHDKCIICGACVEACNKAYGLNWRKLPVFEMDGYKTALSISCNHCDKPACMEVCPANAIKKDEKGVVWIEQEECIGCGYCSWACPYEALKFNSQGVMTKCHFCKDNLGKGMPYCVESCPTGALAFGWIDQEDSSIPYLAPPEITEPRLKVILPKEKSIVANTKKVKSEEKFLPLVGFTIGSEFALGYSMFRLPFFSIITFLILGITLLASISHANVGKRSLRVALGLKSSWLSREVLFGGLASLFFLGNFFFSTLYYPAMFFLTLAFISSLMVYLLKARPSWYNVDTPTSFIGTIFTLSSPLAFLFLHNFIFSIPGIMFSILEIYTAYRKSKVLDTQYKSRYLNFIYIVGLLISLVFPDMAILAFIIALSSEVLSRNSFFKNIVYYGIPNV
ncbi:4Fe-4S dicluster domain-containing protein [Acidianus sp. RZ1]|uniref:4Fe-4S dicluster domain-containing protein n=1 Tax=Acidianus sp. RZ1 TaxID=1540082 RepID=UPI0014922AF9|nr:4Fe-4S dicluster domain-containing protein [Acidianus sp. RZ1]NON62408.1 4Fe-4S binding protein [Acidianus sp. RZ1]